MDVQFNGSRKDVCCYHVSFSTNRSFDFDRHWLSCTGICVVHCLLILRFVWRSGRKTIQLLDNLVADRSFKNRSTCSVGLVVNVLHQNTLVNAGLCTTDSFPRLTWVHASLLMPEWDCSRPEPRLPVAPAAHPCGCGWMIVWEFYLVNSGIRS